MLFNEKIKKKGVDMKKWFAGLFVAIGLAGFLQAKVLVDKTFDNELGKI